MRLADATPEIVRRALAGERPNAIALDLGVEERKVNAVIALARIVGKIPPTRFGRDASPTTRKVVRLLREGERPVYVAHVVGVSDAYAYAVAAILRALDGDTARINASPLRAHLRTVDDLDAVDRRAIAEAFNARAGQVRGAINHEKQRRQRAG